MQETDSMFFLDTGSTDNTYEIIKEHAKKDKRISHHRNVYTSSAWRFDYARNLAMSFIPKEAEICLSLDLDERFEAGWRKKINENWIPNVTNQIVFTFIYSWKEYLKTPKIKLFVGKIHDNRKTFRWINPVHEVLEQLDKDKHLHIVDVPNLTLHHHQTDDDIASKQGSYKPLLLFAMKEEPENSGSLFDKIIKKPR